VDDTIKLDDIRMGLGDAHNMARQISMLDEKSFVVRAAILGMCKTLEQTVDYMAGIPLQVEMKEANFSGPYYSRVDEIENQIDSLAIAARKTDEYLEKRIEELTCKEANHNKTHYDNAVGNSSRIGELESKLYNWDKLKGWNTQDPDSNQNKRLKQLEERIVSIENKLNGSIERDTTKFDVIRNYLDGIVEYLETDKYA
jgi:BMFP domain-containing protein YqiC